MKQTDGFILQTIHGIPYLLPYGQRIAENRKGLRLNQTGVFLWNAIPNANNREELLHLLATHYGATSSEIPFLREDMNTFLDELIAWGMLKEEVPCYEERKTSYFTIAGLHIAMDSPNSVIFNEFMPYAVTSCPHIDMKIEIFTTSGLSTSSLEGKLLVHTDELLVSEHPDGFCLFFPMAGQIHEAFLKKDGSLAQFYCQPPYHEILNHDLFHAIRLVFLYLAQRNGMFALHSASLYYQNRAWLFSGSSGTGKSTHTSLWNREFHTPILNGDLNLISIQNAKPVIHGIPWCGTSGISDPGTYPLGGIILLKQANANYCDKLSSDEKSLFVWQRMISPSWTKSMLNTNLTFSNILTSDLFVTRLSCTKHKDAAHYMKSQIDCNTEIH